MKSSHIGIFGLAFLILLLTVPSAFADYDPTLSMSISDGIDDLRDLKTVSDGNGFSINDFDVATSLYNDAMAALDSNDPEKAQSLLVLAESTHDGIYDQIYLKIEDQQAVRHDEYVMNAKSSLTFLIENGQDLGLSLAVRDQLATTLRVIEYGTNSEIDAATGQIGITLSVLPKDLSLLPSSFTTGSGLGEQLKSKLPPGIAKKYGYSTDNDPGTQSFDDNGDYNGDDNGDDNNGLPEFFRDIDSFKQNFPGFGQASENSGQGKGVGLGDENNLPYGITKKFNPAWTYTGYSPDSEIGGDMFDEGLTEAQRDALAEYYEAKYEAAQEAAEAASEAAQEAAEEAAEEAEEAAEELDE